MRRVAARVAALASVWFGVCAPGQPAPEPPRAPGAPALPVQAPAAFSAEGYDARWTITGGVGRFSLADSRRSRPLITGAEPLIYPGPMPAGVTFTPVAADGPAGGDGASGADGGGGGGDLAIEFTNPTDQPLEFPSINLTRLNFGDAWVWNFSGPPRVRYWSEPVAPTTAHGATYPNEWYSPAVVMGDASHTVGISVLYDPVATDQFVKLEIQGGPPVNGGAGGASAGWDVRIRPLGTLGSGERRSFVVAVRAIRASAAAPGGQWLATLKPYREHFRGLFGGVAYDRDPRPVMGASMAEDSAISPANPRGYTYEHLRPDRHGFGPWTDHLLRAAAARGYERAMLWAVSGLYFRNRQDNYPPQVFSGLVGHRAMDSVGQLRRLPEAGLSVGYWWGNCMFVRREWDAGEMLPLDPSDPERVRLAMREFDSALALGATMIGLDAFPRSTPAAQYRLLWALRARAPGVRLITEVAASDLYHALAPTWVNAEDVRGPHWLADFLLPGHETWAAVRADVLEKRARRALTLPERQRALGAVAGAGYVPVDLSGVPLGARPPRAAPTWLTSVPAHLRLAPAPPRAGFDARVPMPEPQVVVPPAER